MSRFVPIIPNPLPAGEHPPSPPRQIKRRRENTRQACKNCRQIKGRCDGVQPTCGPCAERSKDCEYEFGGPANVSRQSAMKARLSSLESLFQQLRVATAPKAKRVFHRLRTNADVQALLEDLDRGAGQDDGEEEDEMEAGTSQERSHAGSENGCEAISLRDAPVRETLVSIAWHTEIPDAVITSAAVDNFFKCAGQLLHVFSREQATQFQTEVFSQAPRTASWKASACCLCALAAIGKAYDQEPQSSGSAHVYYDVSKTLFEDLIETRSLDAIKVCTLLALYNIFDKATLALVHAEVGMSLAKYYGLETNRQTISMPREQWIDYRKAWRTLLFFKSWLCFTLGYMCGNDILASDTVTFEDLEINGSTDMEDVIQTETAKISLLKAKILRLDLAFRTLSAGTTRTVSDELDQWFAQLPPGMRIETLQRPDLGGDARRSIYYVHLLFQGARMLLYRRILSQFTNIEAALGSSSQVEQFQDALLLGREAANLTSRILKILQDEDGIFKRCWLVIFQAFTAGTLILFEASQKQLHGFSKESWRTDLEMAEWPLAALKFCAEVDPVAKRFHDALLPHRDSLNRYKSNASTMIAAAPVNKAHSFSIHQLWQIPPNCDRTLAQRSFSLQQILCRPFGEPQKQNSDPKRAETQHLDWHLGSNAPFHWNPGPTLPDGGKNTNIEMSRVKNEFLGSPQALGWNPPPNGTLVHD